MLTRLELDQYSPEKYEKMIQEQHLAVLYASQTGTAQEAAERIWRKSKAYGYIGPVLSMDEYSITNLIFEYFVIFVCSTTGNGDPPDNMLKAWRFLKQINLPVTSLYKLKFGVLGLGDSSYIRYNYVAKKLFRRLIQLGAKPILDIGLCDYQHDLGHEAVMEPWISKLFSRLPRARHFIDIGFFVPRYKVSLQDADHKEAPVEDKMADNIYLKEGSNELLLRVHSNVRTTHETHFQDVRLIELKKKDNAPIKYLPGNVFNVRPRNSKEDVDDLFSIFESHNLNIKPDQILVVEELHKRMIIFLLH